MEVHKRRLVHLAAYEEKPTFLLPHPCSFNPLLRPMDLDLEDGAKIPTWRSVLRSDHRPMREKRLPPEHRDKP